MLSQVSGCPMVVIPAGTDSNGVPFAVQLIGPRWHDERLLDIAEAITAAAGGIPASARTMKRGQCDTAAPAFR